MNHEKAYNSVLSACWDIWFLIFFTYCDTVEFLIGFTGETKELLPPEKRESLGRFLLKEKYKFVDKNSTRRKRHTSFHSTARRKNYTCL
jgi:hypothetical protein